MKICKKCLLPITSDPNVKRQRATCLCDVKPGGVVMQQSVPVSTKGCISITEQHAFSLAELVKHYRKMIETLGKDNAALTVAHCDELIEDLSQ